MGGAPGETCDASDMLLSVFSKAAPAATHEAEQTSSLHTDEVSFPSCKYLIRVFEKWMLCLQGGTRRALLLFL